MQRTLIILCLLVFILSVGALSATVNKTAPVVIAHRGASGDFPEHTMAAYEAAVQQNADFVECDAVVSKDGSLVCLHDMGLKKATDVETRAHFADRKTNRRMTPDGNVEELPEYDWFVDDFTVDELRSLRGRQRFASRTALFDGLYSVVTFDEYLRFVRAQNRIRNATAAADGSPFLPIGMYVELKHAVYYERVRNVSVADLMLERLRENGFCVQWTDSAANPCEKPLLYLQSFEASILRALRPKTHIPLVQLVEHAEDIKAVRSIGGQLRAAIGADLVHHRAIASPSGLAAIAEYADGIGLAKKLLVNGTAVSAPLIEQAHAAGLVVHAWTFRNEPNYVISEVAATMRDEIIAFLRAGCDGVFSDHPQIAFSAREYVHRTRPSVYNQTVINVLVNMGVAVCSVVATLLVVAIVHVLQNRKSVVRKSMRDISAAIKQQSGNYGTTRLHDEP